MPQIWIILSGVGDGAQTKHIEAKIVQNRQKVLHYFRIEAKIQAKFHLVLITYRCCY